MRKKLIEVALPLDAINAEAAREKSIRHGHPSTLHLWWARRPLAACRAVLFTSLVDDPEGPEAPPEYLAEIDKLPGKGSRRDKLFEFITKLVKWENSNDKKILGTARKLIQAATDGNPPPVLDPFCGGGSIPLEAQRLGLTVYASDLNPVAVLITKALVEIPPKFAGLPPVNPDAQQSADLHKGTWEGAQGLAEDVRYYGQWMRDEAEKRIGHLYPKGPNGETVIAWLWARTVKCPNPACGAEMPLVRSFALSKKKGREFCVEPIVDEDAKTVEFVVTKGKPSVDGTVNRRGAKCILCDTPVEFDYVRGEGKAGRMSSRLMAIVLDGDNGRAYMPPLHPHEMIAGEAQPTWIPETRLMGKAAVNVPLYGITTHGDLFTPRQLVALTTFSDLVSEARERIKQDALAAGMSDDDHGIADGGTGAKAYADAVAIYLAFAVDKGANYWSSICVWHSGRDIIVSTFARQAIPMVWDFAEANPVSDSTGNFMLGVSQAAKMLDRVPAEGVGRVNQLDATTAMPCECPALCATDPPYYDNIGYADLSDFFYIWLRRSLRQVYPTLFSTVLVPKAEELVATPYRFGGDKRAARDFFEDGIVEAFTRMREAQADDQVMSVYYAFKQQERNADAGTFGLASTGWETMLQGLLDAGFAIMGTWPVRTELVTSLKKNTSALASSIVLVCRSRPDDVPMATRREFVNALRQELPEALENLTTGGIAPVDLAQASIGPGMAVFSRYSKVLEANGQPMTVRTALEIINQELDAYLAAQEGDLDGDTRFCVDWFTQFGLDEAPFGQADVLARAKNTAVDGLVHAGVLESRRGNVRLLRGEELDPDWDPVTDRRLTTWECTHHLIRALSDGGEEAAARLVARLGSGMSQSARSLAYRLYSICDRKGWSGQAQDYNNLVASWPAITADSVRFGAREQTRLLDTE